MRRTLLKSKIHRATVTDANLSYEGSVSIDAKLCEAANFMYYERVEIYNCNNGARFATYIIPGKDGEICLNGAAARMAQPGDIVILATYADFDEAELQKTPFKPICVYVDEKNRMKDLTVGKK